MTVIYSRKTGHLCLADGTPITNMFVGNIDRQVDSYDITSFQNANKTVVPGLPRITANVEFTRLDVAA